MSGIGGIPGRNEPEYTVHDMFESRIDTGSPSQSL
jgi:hypothetical protein